MITVSEKVKIKLRIAVSDTARLGENSPLDNIHLKHKIGSSFKKNSNGPLRGLTPTEEAKFLPRVILIPATDNKFQMMAENYWKNIGREVPADIGLTLEVGMIYPTKEDADKAAVEAEQQANLIAAARKDGRNHTEDFSVRTSLGEPISVEDYILYRYCLLYSKVANFVEDVHKSPRIRFYMESEKTEKRLRQAALDTRRKAYTVYLELVTDRAKVADVVALVKPLVNKYNAVATNLVKLSLEDDIAIDVALEKIATEYGDEFIRIVDDKSLTRKAFIERAIDAGELRRFPNTETIVYGDNTVVGNSMDEAIVFLGQDANKEILGTIKARLKAFQT